MLVRDRLSLPGNMSAEKDVVVHFAQKLRAVVVAAPVRPGTGPDDGVSGVPDKLALGHLVLDVRGAEVHREEDQGEAEHVN